MKNLISSLFLVVMLCMGVLSVSAQQVTKETALEKAISFLQKSESNTSNTRKAPRKAPKLVLANNRDVPTQPDAPSSLYVCCGSS